MQSDIKLLNIEDNKSEIENIILPTGNTLFYNKYKNRNKNNNIIINNITSKYIYKRYNNNNNLFSNTILKEILVENKKNNTSLNKKINNSNKSNKSIKNHNQIQNICPIKKNSLQFLKGKIIKDNKILDKKIYKYYFFQKKLNNRISNIKDINCENNSFSIHYDKKKDNLNNNNNINLEINHGIYSLKNSITIIQEKKSRNINKRNNLINIKNKRINNILNESKDNSLPNKIKNSSSRINFSNILSPKNTSINSHQNKNIFLLTPKSSYTNIHFFKNEQQYNVKIQNNKTLLNDYNNISNLFQKKKINEKKYKKNRHFQRNQNKFLNKNSSLSSIEYCKNENNNNDNEKPSLCLNYNDNNSKKMVKSSSLILRENRPFINKRKRIKSSCLRPIRFNYGFINSFTQKKILDTRFINLKNYKIKDNIISHILDDIQENKSINNNLVSEIYKRPLINIYTLLELKNNEKF